MARRSSSTDLSPALVASLVLHAGAVVLVLILGMYFKKPESMGGGVPITIVSEGPPQARDAEQGDTEEVSAGEILPEPLPEPEPVAPPLPDVKPTPPTKTPPKPAPSPSTKPKADLDFDRLLADVQGARRPPRTQPGGGGGTGKKDRTLAVGTSAGPSAGAKGYLLTLGRSGPPLDAQLPCRGRGRREHQGQLHRFVERTAAGRPDLVRLRRPRRVPDTGRIRRRHSRHTNDRTFPQFPAGTLR